MFDLDLPEIADSVWYMFGDLVPEDKKLERPTLLSTLSLTMLVIGMLTWRWRDIVKTTISGLQRKPMCVG